MKNQKIRKIKEFGDFQTPSNLSLQITGLLRNRGINPSTIIEPNCGTGSFIFSSLNIFPNADIIGMDINRDYIDMINEKLDQSERNNKVDVKQADFFQINWKKQLDSLQKPILIIGNPPWITSAEMTVLNGQNLPIKTNIHKFSGLDAKTGKSNFDIAEWIIITLLESFNGYDGILAMLCKNSVARKVLTYCNNNKLMISGASMYSIDAKKYFQAAVDACLFTCDLKPDSYNYSCKIYKTLESKNPIQVIGFANGELISNVSIYQKWKHLQGQSQYTWRSGIKHDCSKVMELTKKEGILFNGLNEQVLIEGEYLYPMYKSSDIANNRLDDIRRWMIVPQKYIGEETSVIKDKSPLTWDYLNKHSKRLDSRASSIYKNRPRFSIFGVGKYSFSLWKIAISGLYKKVIFRLIQPYKDKPVVLDDTCYLIPANSFEEAVLLYILLNQPVVKEFYTSFIHWDAKRPIQKRILQYLDFKKACDEIGHNKILNLAFENFPLANFEKMEDILSHFS